MHIRGYIRNQNSVLLICSSLEISEFLNLMLWLPEFWKRTRGLTHEIWDEKILKIKKLFETIWFLAANSSIAMPKSKLLNKQWDSYIPIFCVRYQLGVVACQVFASTIWSVSNSNYVLVFTITSGVSLFSSVHNSEFWNLIKFWKVETEFLKWNAGVL